MPDISVILATHNRASFLASCLDSLCAQTLDAARYEICVIASACADATLETVADARARHPRHAILFVEEPAPGLSRARNRGIAATASSLLANIDDDATADPRWLETFIERFAALPAGVAMIGGEIDPVWESEPPAWLERGMKGCLSAAANLGATARYLESGEGLIECNCAYRREAMAAIGNYPEELGRSGASLLSGEGAAHFLLQNRGWRLFFEPAARIRHFIPAARLRPLWFRQRYFWQGVSDYLMHAYYLRHGLPMQNEIGIDLPLAPSDWDFVAGDTAENLGGSLLKFESLGFALALSGLLPTD